MPTQFSTIVLYALLIGGLLMLHVGIAAGRRAMARWAARVKYPDTPDGPRCQACGYILRPNVSVTCPECGVQPVERVLETPPGPMSPIFIVLAATIGLFPITLLVAYPIVMRVDSAWEGWGSASSGLMALKDGRGPQGVIRFVDLGEKQVNLDRRTISDPLRRLTFPLTKEGVAELLMQPPRKPSLKRRIPTEAEAMGRAELIVSDATELSDGKWPEERFNYQLKGKYWVDDRFDFGPCLFVPDYAFYCLPFWLGTSALAALWIAGRVHGEKAERRRRAKVVAR